MVKIFKSQPGFTLVEVIIVIAIAGILLAVTISSLLSWAPSARLRGMAQEVYADMQRARTTAIKDNGSITFSFTTVAASGDGTCSGGSYSFTDSGGNVIAAKNFLNTNFCLAPVTDGNLSPPVPAATPASVFVAGDGFTSRGTPTNPPPAAPSPSTKGIALTDNTTRSPAVFVITQTVAGGVFMERY